MFGDDESYIIQFEYYAIAFDALHLRSSSEFFFAVVRGMDYA